MGLGESNNNTNFFLTFRKHEWLASSEVVCLNAYTVLIRTRLVLRKNLSGSDENSMENKAFKETEAGTELNQVTIHGNVKATTTCTPQVCRTARQRYQPPDLANNSPWNQKKTYFFIGVISLLVVWIIVYTVVSELKLV
ncbi:hypothetical protein HUJ04_013502 [Dendroctonus ponderosae]|nr:hypothetical protein HUJ04_013502 [Dendroctonus ponderosae]